MTPEGDGVPVAGGRGRGFDGNSPATLDTEANRDISSGEEIASWHDLSAPQRPHQGTTESGGSKVITHRNTNGADGARPDHVALARREYSLLAP